MSFRHKTRRIQPSDTGKPPAHSAVHRTRAIRDAAVVLGGLAIAVAVTPVLCVIPAGAGLIAPLWIAAVLWTVLASLAQALWQGVTYGDWSAFWACDCGPNDDDFDFSTKSGSYVDLAIRDQHKALMYDRSDLF